MEKTKILVVAGPTASGKTTLAISLARHFNGEIISADSMQIYRGMDIATAKPTASERTEAKHHLIDFLSVEETFSVADFSLLASKKIEEIAQKNKMPIIAGGTGLYIDTLTQNIQLPAETGDEAYRRELFELAEEKGNSFVLEMLKKIDSKTAEKLHENNLNRIVRALEIYKTTGVTMSEHVAKSKSCENPYDPFFIGLNFRNRQNLYDRINSRVDKMLDSGLLEEAKNFYKTNPGITAASAIGYKELKPFLDGTVLYEEAVENLKRETRRYAKRQLTWFKRNEKMHWIFADDYDSPLQISEEAIKLCNGFLEETDNEKNI